ncbi:MAG: tRNA dimethylallyltransferase, partial [Patescibacteria group bacterium]
LKQFSIFNFQFSNKSKKIEKKFKIIKIPYHLIDVVSPKKRFDLAKYQKLAFQAIDDILNRGKLPILVGGSGLYLQAVVDNFKLSAVKKNLVLRKNLEKLNVDEIYVELKKHSPVMAGKINNSDKKNKRRLIRYLEILLSNKNSKNKIKNRVNREKEKYQTLIIGKDCSKQTLKKKIYKRIINRLEKEEMINEVKQLHKRGLSWRKLENFGLEYKFISLYLQAEFTYEEMVEKLNIATNQFASRQMSWFRRWERQGAKINWLEDNKKIEKLVKVFL